MHVRRSPFQSQAYQIIVALLLTLSATLAGCANGVPVKPVAATGQDSAGRETRTSAPALHIDADASEIRLLVYRDGPLQRFGHDHVISGPLAGVIYAADNAGDSGFHIEVPVSELQVDPQPLRDEEGERFRSSISDEARAATRENLLGAKVLDADNYPKIIIESVALTGPRWNPEVTATVSVRGQVRQLQFPAAVFEGDDRTVVIATFRLLQTDFGIEPFSVMGGGLRVADEIDVRVQLIARH